MGRIAICLSLSRTPTSLPQNGLLGTRSHSQDHALLGRDCKLCPGVDWGGLGLTLEGTCRLSSPRCLAQPNGLHSWAHHNTQHTHLEGLRAVREVLEHRLEVKRAEYAQVQIGQRHAVGCALCLHQAPKPGGCRLHNNTGGGVWSKGACSGRGRVHSAEYAALQQGMRVLGHVRRPVCMLLLILGICDDTGYVLARVSVHTQTVVR